MRSVQSTRGPLCFVCIRGMNSLGNLKKIEHIFPQLPLIFVGFQLGNSNLALEKARKDTGFFKKTTYIKGDHLKNPLILNKSRRKEFTATLVKSSSSWVAGVVTGRWWWHDAGGGVQLSNVAVKWLKLVPQVPLRTIYYAPWPPKHHFGTCTTFF